MKQTASIKTTLRTNLMLLGVLIIVSYIALITLAYSFGLNKLLEIASRVEGMMIERQLVENPTMPLPRNHLQSIYQHWKEVPGEWKKHFDHLVLFSAQQYETIITVEDELQLITMNHYFMANGKPLFIFSRMTEEEVSYLVKGVIDVGLNYLLIGIALILLLLLGIIIVLVKRITSPVLALNRWASNLGNELHPKPQQFFFTELNELANNLLGAITRSARLADAEHAFLKHASHEMRTPLAIMQASLDTLQEQQLKRNLPLSKPLLRSVRACHNMQHLTNTLLWLARESQEPIAKQECKLHCLLEEQLQANQYVLNNKDIIVRKNKQTITLFIEIPLLRIILANLIRNAYQYTEQGEIVIEISKDSIAITNPCCQAMDVTLKEPGFGLGLQLVKRICNKVGWEVQWLTKNNAITILIQWANMA